MRKHYPPLPNAQEEFLDERIRKAIEQQPEIADLRLTLLKLGGLQLVPPRKADNAVPRLLATGQSFGTGIKEVRMIASQCHRNIARLWHDRYPGLTAICTGYALSADGLWRQHSWGLLPGLVLETTEPRDQYFGIAYSPDESDRFMKQELGA